MYSLFGQKCLTIFINKSRSISTKNQELLNNRYLGYAIYLFIQNENYFFFWISYLIITCNHQNSIVFQEPNPEDPLNKDAAEVLQSNRRIFEQNVSRSMRGGYVGSTYFERCLK